MVEIDATIVSNSALGNGYFVLNVEAAQALPEVVPGQFAHVYIPGMKDGLLRRPFSIYKAERHRLAFLYKVVGKGTRALSQLGPGASLNLIAPLGRGFSLPVPDGAVPVVVAGGYGVAPLSLLAARSGTTGVACIGGKTGRDILCVDEFRTLGWEVHVTTEDGSEGECGLVTVAVERVLGRVGPRAYVYACGPVGMLRSVAELARRFGVRAEVSLDRHMCCGVGVCWTCVVPVKSGAGWEYVRACKTGPVFDVAVVEWDRLS